MLSPHSKYFYITILSLLPPLAFAYLSLLIYSHCLSTSIPRARICARLPTAILFFCCHKCHIQRKSWWKNIHFWGLLKWKNRPMSLSSPAYFLHLKHPFVKIHKRGSHNKLKYKTLSITAWHLWQQKEKNSCNAHVRVRETEKKEGGYKYFYISKSWLMDCVSLWCFFTSERAQKTTRHFMKNKHSFYRKQHVVLWKQSIALYKSPHWWKQRKNPADTTCINISIKRIIEGQKPRSCAKSERREVEKQRKSNEDIAKQKRHLPPICQKKVYWSNQFDIFYPPKDQNIKTNW